MNATTTETPRDKDPVASLAGQISFLGNGDRSTLRRMPVGGTPEGDGLVMGLLLRAGVRVNGLDEAEFAAWRTTALVAAIVSGSAGRPCHAPGRSLGRALGTVRFSKERLTRLVGSNHDAVVRASRMLHSKGETPFDLRNVRDMLDPDPATRSAASRRLVVDHQSGQFAQTQKEA